MSYLTIVGVTLGLILSASCQYQQRDRDDDHYQYQNTPPPPQILTHKQALNHDGNFKYVFTSENGLAQGESIAPDGTRNGGYSYVDPTGRKISVKYTAGKEGFRILEADHLPKAPQPIAPLPPHQQQAYQQQQPAFHRGEDDGQYRPQIYERPQEYERPQQQLIKLPTHTTHTRPIYPGPSAVSPAPLTNAIEREEKDYFDEPGKAHSFGNGYLFEFSG